MYVGDAPLRVPLITDTIVFRLSAGCAGAHPYEYMRNIVKGCFAFPEQPFNVHRAIV